MIKVKCNYCNKILYISNWHNKNSKNKFCNQKCYSKWQATYIKGKKHYLYKRKKVKCSTCDKILYRTPSEFKKYKYLFCNQKCYTKWQLKYRNGKQCPAYVNGKSKEPYTLEFYKKKNKIRQRDNFVCQNCGCTEEEHIIVFGRVLDVHHIDYNKKNDKNKNLISLCMSCNARANYNRKQWKIYYQNKIREVCYKK